MASFVVCSAVAAAGFAIAFEGGRICENRLLGLCKVGQPQQSWTTANTTTAGIIFLVLFFIELFIVPEVFNPISYIGPTTPIIDHNSSLGGGDGMNASYVATLIALTVFGAWSGILVLGFGILISWDHALKKSNELFQETKLEHERNQSVTEKRNIKNTIHVSNERRAAVASAAAAAGQWRQHDTTIKHHTNNGTTNTATNPTMIAKENEQRVWSKDLIVANNDAIEKRWREMEDYRDVHMKELKRRNTEKEEMIKNQRVKRTEQAATERNWIASEQTKLEKLTTEFEFLKAGTIQLKRESTKKEEEKIDDWNTKTLTLNDRVMNLHERKNELDQCQKHTMEVLNEEILTKHQEEEQLNHSKPNQKEVAVTKQQQHNKGNITTLPTTMVNDTDDISDSEHNSPCHKLLNSNSNSTTNSTTTTKAESILVEEKSSSTCNSSKNVPEDQDHNSKFDGATFIEEKDDDDDDDDDGDERSDNNGKNEGCCSLSTASVLSSKSVTKNLSSTLEDIMTDNLNKQNISTEHDMLTKSVLEAGSEVEEIPDDSKNDDDIHSSSMSPFRSGVTGESGVLLTSSTEEESTEEPFDNNNVYENENDFSCSTTSSYPDILSRDLSTIMEGTNDDSSEQEYYDEDKTEEKLQADVETMDKYPKEKNNIQHAAVDEEEKKQESSFDASINVPSQPQQFPEKTHEQSLNVFLSASADDDGDDDDDDDDDNDDEDEQLLPHAEVEKATQFLDEKHKYGKESSNNDTSLWELHSSFETEESNENSFESNINDNNNALVVQSTSLTSLLEEPFDCIVEDLTRHADTVAGRVLRPHHHIEVMDEIQQQQINDKDYYHQQLPQIMITTTDEDLLSSSTTASPSVVIDNDDYEDRSFIDISIDDDDECNYEDESFIDMTASNNSTIFNINDTSFEDDTIPIIPPSDTSTSSIPVVTETKHHEKYTSNTRGKKQDPVRVVKARNESMFDYISNRSSSDSYDTTIPDDSDNSTSNTTAAGVSIIHDALRNASTGAFYDLKDRDEEEEEEEEEKEDGSENNKNNEGDDHYYIDQENESILSNNSNNNIDKSILPVVNNSKSSLSTKNNNSNKNDSHYTLYTHSGGNANTNRTFYDRKHGTDNNNEKMSLVVSEESAVEVIAWNEPGSL